MTESWSYRTDKDSRVGTIRKYIHRMESTSDGLNVPTVVVVAVQMLYLAKHLIQMQLVTYT